MAYPPKAHLFLAALTKLTKSIFDFDLRELIRSRKFLA